MSDNHECGDGCEHTEISFPIVEILPLNGKYYGTVVLVVESADTPPTKISVWHPAGDPSDRELAGWCGGITREQWNNNELIEFTDEPEPARELGITSSPHYESITSIELAKVVQKAIKEYLVSKKS